MPWRIERSVGIKGWVSLLSFHLPLFQWVGNRKRERDSLWMAFFKGPRVLDQCFYCMKKEMTAYITCGPWALDIKVDSSEKWIKIHFYHPATGPEGDDPKKILPLFIPYRSKIIGSPKETKEKSQKEKSPKEKSSTSAFIKWVFYNIMKGRWN